LKFGRFLRKQGNQVVIDGIGLRRGGCILHLGLLGLCRGRFGLM
jgi:hypothetical protein